MGLIWGKPEAEYFLREGWTGGIGLIWFEKFVFGRRAMSTTIWDHKDNAGRFRRRLISQSWIGEDQTISAGSLGDPAAQRFADKFSIHRF